VLTPKIKGEGPERGIQDAVIKMLQGKGWYVLETHGNMYQQGFPDLYTCKLPQRGMVDPGTSWMHGMQRWVEIKNPTAYRFTPAQLKVFPQLSAQGVGIWILTAATEYQYERLFHPPNWHTFLRI